MSQAAYRRGLSALIAAALWVAATAAGAGPLPFSTAEIAPFLLIGNGPENSHGGKPGVGKAVDIDNFEIGANKNRVPAVSGSLLGPTLQGAVPNIPLNARPVGTGITFDGNVAILDSHGVYELSDVGVYADYGIACAGPLSSCKSNVQNSFFNDPNQFPNTFTSSGPSNPGVNNNVGGTGSPVNPNDAVQATRMDGPANVGQFGNVNLSGVVAALFGPTGASAVVPTLAATGTLNVSGNGGKISSHTEIDLAHGLNVINIVTGGSDFLLENANFVIDGFADSFAIFRVPDTANFLISNGNILVGTSGIGLNNVLFYSDRPDNAGHFTFNNTILNGVAFWTLGQTGGEIVINNAQGCTQLIADKINLNDVRFMRCAFDAGPEIVPTIDPVPEPRAIGLILVAAAALMFARRRVR